uniref:G-protein coupled receptors family 1 profile domain-containing protein n=1 Tax=Wuchereria bancrofti TaxID=6293 RepID=A0A1I8EQ75_WUCBA
MAHSYCIIALFLILPSNCHAQNTTNVFDIRDECNTVEKYVAVVLFSLLLLYGIVSNILLMVIFCSHDNLYSHSFVLIASQIIVCSFLNFTPQVTIVVLKILRNKNFEGRTNFNMDLPNIFCYEYIFVFRLVAFNISLGSESPYSHKLSKI